MISSSRDLLPDEIFANKLFTVACDYIRHNKYGHHVDYKVLWDMAISQAEALASILREDSTR